MDVELETVRGLLIEKNKRYGNSALEPLRIASKASANEQLLVRIDDKLSRIQQGDESEDVWLDLLGYVVLLRVNKARERRNEQRRDVWVKGSR